ncbi:MAG: 3-deoxy-D-manno-octulosonic acid transferase [Candidatus Binataceae bacterium]
MSLPSRAIFSHAAMLHHLYNAIWYPALPFALIAGGGDLRARLGRGVDALHINGGPRLWLHAASVGEVEAISMLAAALMNELPDAAVIVTTMTATGLAAARRRIPKPAVHRLAPLDHPGAVRSFVERVRPDLVLVAETELWPNYFAETRRAGARIAIVNGRISKRSFSRYRWLRPLFSEMLAHTDLVLAQTEADARRYRELGAPGSRVVVAGNTKFDLAALSPPPLRPALARLADERRLVIAGSTAPGEEAIVIKAWRTISASFPDTVLILAPRHLNRLSEIEALISAAGFTYEKASALPDVSLTASVVILDTIGELRSLYYRARLAFVGGSLAQGRGGQSLAEPAAAAIPVLFGPFHESQAQIAGALIRMGGGRIAGSAGELAGEITDLLEHEQRRADAGAGARRALESLGGGVAASLPLLKELANQRKSC